MPAPVAPMVLAALGLGALMLPARKTSASSPSAQSSSRTWTQDPTEQISAPTAAFLDRLAAAVPDIPIYVTDALRTPADQASAMWDKAMRGEDLYALYQRDDLVAEFMAATSLEAAISVMENQVARGELISRHLWRDEYGLHALDLRTRNLSSSQVSRLKAAAEKLGAKALFEGDHLHLERLPHA